MIDPQVLNPSTPVSVLVHALLPSAVPLQLAQVVVATDQITLTLVSVQTQADCPLCEQPSRQIQSRYTRLVADLPWANCCVRLLLLVRRFFCHTTDCARAIFTERLPAFLEPYARRTNRLRQHLVALGFELGGEAGARRASSLSMPISPDTLLTLLRAQSVAEHPTPRVLGVDDWSFRRGRHMGTILVDLERHLPVDLLPNSSEEAFAAWLREHPGVEIISRDRGGTYASAGRAGAPEAIQVADRWHLCKNLGDGLQKLLTRQAAALRQAAQSLPASNSAQPRQEIQPPPAKARPRPRSTPAVSVQRQRQLAMYEQVRARVAEGWSVAAIVRALKLSPITVRKYRNMETFCDGRKMVRVSAVEAYRAYLEQRWAEGCNEVKQLWEELQAQGYSGSYKSVWSFTRGWELPETVASVTAPAPPSQAARTPRQAMWLLVQPADKLNEADTAYREQLCQQSVEVAAAYPLAQDFQVMIRERQVEQLDPWLESALSSGVRELKRFALGLQQDYAAVRAALDSVWSNGQVEGQVTKLKLVKRQMYGRAKFDLLRARVLYRP